MMAEKPIGCDLDLCCLCLEDLLKPTDRNYVHGKSNAILEIEKLPLRVNLRSVYICKKCLVTLKKRRDLLEKLEKIEEELLQINPNAASKVQCQLIGESDTR